MTSSDALPNTSRAPVDSSAPVDETLGPVAATAIAFCVLGLVDLAVEAGHFGARIDRPGVRALHFLFTLLEHFAIAAIGAWLVAGFFALRRVVGRSALLPFGLLFAALALSTLPDDLDGLAEKLSARNAGLLSGLIASFLAIDAFGLVFFATLIAKTRMRLAILGPGLALAILSALILPGEYPAAHLWMGLVSGALVAVALAGVRTTLSRRLRNASVTLRAVAVGVSLALVAALFAPIPNAVLAEMMPSPGAFLAPFAARFRSISAPEVEPPAAARAWFSSRAKSPPVPHVEGHALPKGAVVVLITIDAVRADVIMSGKYDAELPSFAKLRADSVRFPEARAPASQTVPSITAIMTGRYYSEVFWSGGAPRHSWPAADKSIRFPALLRKAGVVTVTFPSLPDLESEKGIVRGFDEEEPVDTRSGEPSPYWNEMLEVIAPRLESAAKDSRPTFLYAHFLDPHAPYTRGGTDCDKFTCYVREIALVDKAIGEIARVMDGDGLRDRSALIVSADHGEAFGEHGTFYHATNLYEELLRVPLLVHGSAFAPHTVASKVTLLDLGPTILDLYGLDTPASFMGESLAGALRGEATHFTRPIAADSGRFMRAMYFDDGSKLILDETHRLLELYDLGRDPGERRALYDETPGAEERFGLLRLFFQANAFTKSGYSRPFRQ